MRFPLWRREKRNKELSEEMQAHLTLAEREAMESGQIGEGSAGGRASGIRERRGCGRSDARRVGLEMGGGDVARRAVWRPKYVADAGFHGGDDPDAGAGDWSEHRDFLGGGRGAFPGAAVPRCREAGVGDERRTAAGRTKPGFRG